MNDTDQQIQKLSADLQTLKNDFSTYQQTTFNSKQVNIFNVLGNIQAVKNVPTVTPSTLYDSIQIADVSGITSLYVYDTNSSAWKKVGGSGFAVGGIYINTTGTNPNTELGYGTWVAYGAGQVLVGYKSGDANFGTAGGTGGEVSHTLTTAEIPAHTHPTLTAQSNGSSTNTGGVGNSALTSPTTGSTGGGGAHNNLQPYIVVYFWQRTA